MSLLSYPKQHPVAISQETKILASDAQLLTDFLKLKNEAAFKSLVNRYGSLVFSVALRIVRDRHIAEDVTQATFLLLAKDAKKIKRREALGSWLHGVAIRLAKKSIKRRSREQVYNVVTEQEVAEKSFEEIHSTFEQQVLDEELQKLPAHYRDPLVLHFLQGKTYEETAQQLGVTLGAIEGRMKRGKRELKLRLTKRGVSLGAAVAALSWSQAEAAVSLQPEMIHTIAENGLAAFQGTAFTPVCSPEAVYLAGKELTMLTATKIALMTLVLTTAVGTGWVTHAGFAQDVSGGTAGAKTQLQTQVSDTESARPRIAATVVSEKGTNNGAEANPFESIDAGGDGLSQGSQPAAVQPDLTAQLNLLRQQLNALAASQSDPFSNGMSEEMTAQIRKLQADLARLTELYARQKQGNKQNGMSAGSQPAQYDFGMDIMMSGMEMGMGFGPAPVKTTLAVEKNQSPAAEKIEQALGELNKSIELIDQPLQDAISNLSETYEIPILINEQELENEGLSADEPINLVLSENTISTRDALELMLEQLDLTYIIKNGVMMITTQTGADSYTETRVYDVRPLKIEDPEALTDVLLRTVEPDSWAQLGGSGEMSYLNGSLIVIQSQQVHEKIEVLLNQLAKQVVANPDSPSWPAKDRSYQGGGGMQGAGGGLY